MLRKNPHQNDQQVGVVAKNPTGTFAFLLDSKHLLICKTTPKSEEEDEVFNIRFKTINFQTKEFTAEHVIMERPDKVLKYRRVDKATRKVFDILAKARKYIQLSGKIISSSDTEIQIKFWNTTGEINYEELTEVINEERTANLDNVSVI